jgi:hypothetical protein
MSIKHIKDFKEDIISLFMGSVEINGRTVTWDDSKSYRTIGVRWSGHGGEIRGPRNLNPKLLFYRQGEAIPVDKINEFEVTYDLRGTYEFLKTGRYADRTVLDETERPAFERAAHLYLEILVALEKEELIDDALRY